MEPRTHEKKLLVEGKGDEGIIPYFIEKNGIKWGDEPSEWIISIEPRGSFKEIIKPGALHTELKESGTRILGAVIDADENQIEGRWTALRRECLRDFPDTPAELPEDGLIIENDDGKKLGIWIMPDNRSDGMMETFLALLVKEEGQELWSFAQECTANAQDRGATYKSVHTDKARIFNYLAWCHPPGRQLHDAVKFKILDPKAPQGQKFFHWFKELFEL